MKISITALDAEDKPITEEPIVVFSAYWEIPQIDIEMEPLLKEFPNVRVLRIEIKR
jgi:hypothetical protein